MKYITTLLLVSVLGILFGGCDGPPPGAPVTPVAGASPPIQSAPRTKLDSNLLRRNFYVVFDGSGSMEERRAAGNSTKILVAKQAVGNFAKLLMPEDNLGLFVFDGHGVSERVPLGSGPQNRQAFNGAVQEIVANGGTPLYQAIGTGVAQLSAQMQKQLGYGEYHLVVVTDGEASDRDDGIINRIVASPIILHTIGFGISGGHSLNQPGKVYYAEAQNPDQLVKGLSSVLAESTKF
ncbi:MAG: hypothetical protein RLZZ347_366 [Candidatus Parcubacteria bacterium]|jgi:hypothetical protein